MDVSLMDVTGAGPTGRGRLAAQEKQGAAGITTAAPYVASQWGRGDDRLPGERRGLENRSRCRKLFLDTVK
jgi:hypothetical protein